MGYSGEVELMVDEIQNISKNFYISDKLTGNSYNLKNGKISLILDKSVYTHRFALAFTSNIALSVEEAILSKYTIFI
jgi:hypothetical protein